jgi:DNA polymerase-3 subunit delta
MSATSSALKALTAALKSRAFEPVYLFHGDDDYRKDGALKALAEAAVDASMRDFNVEVRRGPDVDAETLGSLLARRRCSPSDASSPCATSAA